MTNHIVPEEAVEAALESVFSTSELSRHVWGPTIRAILEAGAPLMLAGAWDAGHESGFWNGRGSHGDVTGVLIGIEHAKARNPYRTTK